MTIDTLIVEHVFVEAKSKKEAKIKALNSSIYNGQGDTTVYSVELLEVDE